MALESLVADLSIPTSSASRHLRMVPIQDTTISIGNIFEDAQNPRAALRCVLDALMSIGIRNDAVWWPTAEVFFNEEAISHQLSNVRNTRAGRGERARLDFDGHQTVGRLDQVIGFTDKPVRPRYQWAS